MVRIGLHAAICKESINPVCTLLKLTCWLSQDMKMVYNNQRVIKTDLWIIRLYYFRHYVRTHSPSSMKIRSYNELRVLQLLQTKWSDQLTPPLPAQGKLSIKNASSPLLPFPTIHELLQSCPGSPPKPMNSPP